MKEAGQDIDSRAPAGLGALLSQAIFFLDFDLGASLTKARIDHAAARQEAFDEWQAHDGLVNQRELYAALAGQSEAQLRDLVYAANEKIYKSILRGSLLTNGLSEHARFEIPRALWENHASGDIAQWLKNKAALGGTLFSSIRVRPLEAVSYEVAVYATAEDRALANYLSSNFKDLRLLDSPLLRAARYGFVSLEQRIVFFPGDIEAVAALPVRVTNWPVSKADDSAQNLAVPPIASSTKPAPTSKTLVPNKDRGGRNKQFKTDEFDTEYARYRTENPNHGPRVVTAHMQRWTTKNARKLSKNGMNETPSVSWVRQQTARLRAKESGS